METPRLVGLLYKGRLFDRAGKSYPLIFVDKMSGRSIWLNKDRNAVMSRVFRLPGEKEGKGLAY